MQIVNQFAIYMIELWINLLATCVDVHMLAYLETQWDIKNDLNQYRIYLKF